MAGEGGHDFSAWIVVATTIFNIWTWLFAGLRTWAKTKRSLTWALYDNFFTIAFILSIGECASIYTAVHYGFGKIPGSLTPDNEQHMEKALYAGQLLYILSIGISKLSTILFLRSLVRDPIHKRICYGVIAIVSCWSLASVLVIALRGNLLAPWQVLYAHDRLYTRWLGVETAGLVLELMMWCVSVLLCWGLNMPWSKRVRVASIFGSRMFLVPIVIVRLYFLSRAHSAFSLDTIAIAQVFTQAAMQYSLMAECLTCLKPFLHPFHSSYEWSSVDGSARRRHGLHPIFNNPRREAYTSVTASNTSGRSDKVPERSISQRLGLDPEEHAQEDMLRRADNVVYSAQIRRDSSVGRLRGVDRLESSSSGSGSRSDRAIHQTTTVSVDHDPIEGLESRNL